MIDGDETDGGFSLVEHPMPPRALAAPEPDALAGLAARHGLEVDLESVPRLTKEYGLHFGPPAQ